MAQNTTYGKADVHVHTVFSDGLMTPEVLVEYVATHTNLDVLAVTDHDTIAGALVAQAFHKRFASDLRPLEIVVGEEVTSTDGDILALFIEKQIDPGMSAADTITAIHKAGGLAVAAHPCAHITTWMQMDGMKGVGRKMGQLPLDAIEARNGTPTEFYANPLAGWINARGPRHAVTGGSDTHYLTTVGSTYTIFPGRTAAELRTAIESKKTRAGGHVYSPLLIFNVIHDMLSRRLPIRHITPTRAANWPLA